MKAKDRTNRQLARQRSNKTDRKSKGNTDWSDTALTQTTKKQSSSKGGSSQGGVSRDGDDSSRGGGRSDN